MSKICQCKSTYRYQRQSLRSRAASRNQGRHQSCQTRRYSSIETAGTGTSAAVCASIESVAAFNLLVGYQATFTALTAFSTNSFGCNVRFTTQIRSLAGFGGFTVETSHYWRRRSSGIYGHGLHPGLNWSDVAAVDA